MNTIALNIFVQMFLSGLPTTIVCLGAFVVILSRTKRSSPWTLWALSGFGLGLLISIAMPATQAIIQGWVLRNGHNGGAIWIFTLLGFFWSLMRACVYALLFIAVFEGRKSDVSVQASA
jgi:hypothetical protein